MITSVVWIPLLCFERIYTKVISFSFDYAHKIILCFSDQNFAFHIDHITLSTDKTTTTVVI